MSDEKISELIETLTKIEKEGRLNIMNVIAINDGHLRPSLYGMTMNLNLSDGTLISWLLAGMFLGLGLLFNSIFGHIGLMVFVTLIQACIIYLSWVAIKEYERVMSSIRNIKYAIDNKTIYHETEVVNDEVVSFMKSNDEDVTKSLGLISKYIGLFRTRKLLGAILLKHRNHMPMSILLIVSCAILYSVSNQIMMVGLVLLALVASTITYFIVGGMLYKTLSEYFSSIKESVLQSIKEESESISEDMSDEV